MTIDPIKGKYTLSQGWNAFSYMYPQWGYRHKGLDFSTYRVPGLESLAICDGVITFAGVDGNWGNLVKMKCSYGEVWQAHHASLRVKAGDQVKRGDTIGIVGSTGLSTGIHVHLGVKVAGDWVDPTPYLSLNEEAENMSIEELAKALSPYFVKKDVRINLDTTDGSVWIINHSKRYKVGTQPDDIAIAMSLMAAEQMSDAERKFPVTTNRKDVL